MNHLHRDSSRFNITVIGAPGVGKSALTLRLLYQEFVDDYEPTKLDSYQTILDHYGREVDVQITDTAGQEDYASVRDTFLRSGEGFLCVFSLTDTESYNYITELYSQVKVAKNAAPPDLPFLIVGNKCDMEGSRQIASTDAAQLAASLGVQYMETSAKTNYNVSEGFQMLIGMLIKARVPKGQIEDCKKKKKKRFRGIKKFFKRHT